MARKDTDAEPTRRRRPLWLAARIAFWGLVAWFAIQGGEYGTTDLFKVRRDMAETKAAIDSLKRVVDSLSLRKHDVLTNPAVQERIAREEFGMVKGDKELVFHVLPPDSVAAVPDSSAGRAPAP